MGVSGHSARLREKWTFATVKLKCERMKVRLYLRIKHTSTVKAGFIEFIESAYQFTKMSFN